MISLSSSTLEELMLQFLLADYLPGYRLPSLRKTITTSTMTVWTLTSDPNCYTLTRRLYGDRMGFSRFLIDKCHCETLAVRLSSNDYVISLLEDGSERKVNMYAMPDHGKGDVASGYLTEGE